MNTYVKISEQARALAEKRAREEGFDSLDEYVDVLIREDQAVSTASGWLRSRIEEGLASPGAGELTREKFDRLVSEGIARAQRRE